MIKFCDPLIPDMALVARYLQPSFEAGHLSNFGPAYKLLCERLHAYLKLDGGREIVLVSSGHTALQAAYHVLNLNSPAIPDYTFRSTLVASFADPVIVDCDSNGFLDITELDNDCDGAVVVCPMSRIPDLGYYQEKCRLQNLSLVIDGAATFGTPGICNYGDAFCLSFHATKTFSIGECGAVVCSNDLATKVRQYINFGFDAQRNPVMHGTNAKVSEYTCAVGLALLDQIEQSQAIARRLRNASIYENGLEKFTLPSYATETVYQTFPIYVSDIETAERIRTKLKECQVEFLQYYKPLTSLPNAKKLYEGNLCLPCHQNVTEDQAKYICGVIRSVI
jgi:dTDP-4-amino-4,6-dideoxygalactose transaminase